MTSFKGFEAINKSYATNRNTQYHVLVILCINKILPSFVFKPSNFTACITSLFKTEIMAFDEQSRRDFENHRHLYEESTGREYDSGKRFRNTNNGSGNGCLPIFLILLTVLLTLGCGETVESSTTENSDFCPVHITFKGEYSAIIDENSKVWQWRYDNNYNIIDLQKVNVPKANSIVLDYHDGLGWAVTSKGKLYQWLLYDPSQNEQVKTDKPVVKMIATNNYKAMLHRDGTINSNGGASSVGPFSGSNINKHINHAAFTGIKDIHFHNGVLLAINKVGDLLAASGKGVKHLNILGEPSNDGNPLKIEGLNRIKRVFPTTLFMTFAIDEDNTVHYWNSNVPKNGFQTLDVKANFLPTAERVVDSKGMNYRIIDEKRTGIDLKTGFDDLPFPEGYGLWYIGQYPSCKKVIALDKEGKLWQFDFLAGYDSDKRTVSNPVRIGDFKVQLDYFKS